MHQALMYWLRYNFDFQLDLILIKGMKKVTWNGFFIYY